MFCPECGSTDKEMINGVCSDCFLKTYTPISVPSNLKVILCAHCNSTLKEGKWKKADGLEETDIIYQTLEDNIVVDSLVDNDDTEIVLNINRMRGSTAECSVEAIYLLFNQDLTYKVDVEVKLQNSLCPDCSKRDAGYYETVIQLRADSRELSSEEINLADETIIKSLKHQETKDKLAYIAQRLVLKEGVDYYVGSHKSAKKLLSSLRDVFGGTVKESPRLMGQDKNTGKGLYRFWISLRLASFGIGDFIEYNDIVYQVTGINSKKFQVYNLVDCSETSILWREYDKVSLLKRADEVNPTTITSISPNTIQILDPLTYDVIDLEMKEEYGDYHIGEEINVLNISGNVYIIPTIKK